MKKITGGLLLMMVAFFINAASAQSVEIGKKFLYYERYQSAKNVFNSLVTANPKDEEAIYYLGQADIGLEKVADAKKLYLQKLSEMPNSPLILAGVGHIELIEGKTADARQHFETAISLSKGKEIAVFNAIGYANGNPDSKNGNAAYAIDILKRATQVKKFNDPEVYANLGDAYRKLADGGNAISAYQSALAIDPNYARAIYRSGRVYQTQGRGQEELYLKYYNEAIAKDTKYAPVYNTLFNYYFETDVPKSSQFLDKWLSASDDDPKACMYRAQMKYAEGLFDKALSMAGACIQAEGANPYPKLYQLQAFSYKRLGDTTKSRASFDEYFKRQDSSKIEGGDYAAYATVLLGDTLNNAKVNELTRKAVMMDTLEANKISYIKTVATAYSEAKNNKAAANWYARILDVKRNFTNVDIFNAGYNFYAASELDSSNKYFTLYTQKYPEDIMGFYMLGNGNALIDSTGALGLAVPYYAKTIQIGESDTTKAGVKSRLINAYKFFVGYHYNNKKSKDSALFFIDKVLALDPTDQNMIQNREFISKNGAPTTQKPAAAATTKPAAAPATKPAAAIKKPAAPAVKKPATPVGKKPASAANKNKR